MGLLINIKNKTPLIGIKVNFNSKDNGIVKSYSEDDSEFVFVVYYCNNDWENYQKYTGIRTNKKDLKFGWI